MTGIDTLRAGLARIEAQQSAGRRYRDYWTGSQPAAYLSRDAAESLDARLRRLGVNYPRLAVMAHAERLALTGIEYRGKLAEPVWSELNRAGGCQLAELVHTDRALFGAAYLTVWADDTGQPTMTGDTPLTMTIGRDPTNGSTAWAVRRWESADAAHAVLYEPGGLSVYRGPANAVPAAEWKLITTVENPLEAVPVVPFVRRQSLSDPCDMGASLIDDITDLTDAVSKLLADAMVTSEYHARPRRWATGLEIEEDEDGNPVDPFGKKRFLQSESPETKFGQLDGARLDGYADMIATLTQQIGALTGIPPHYLGLHGDQPASADAVRAAETQLVTAAYEAQRQLSESWARVGWLLDAVIRQATPDPAALRDWSALWQSPETRTPAQAADAALKHRMIGVPLEYVVRHLLDYPADQIEDIVSAARADALLGGATRNGLAAL